MSQNELTRTMDHLHISIWSASLYQIYLYMSDLLENIVNIIDVHHLENC